MLCLEACSSSGLASTRAAQASSVCKQDARRTTKHCSVIRVITSSARAAPRRLSHSTPISVIAIYATSCPCGVPVVLEAVCVPQKDS